MKQLFLGFFKNKIKADTFNISLFPILILVFIWTYGYLGALTRSSPALQILITISLIAIMLLLFFVNNEYVSKNKIGIILIGKNDIKIFLLILLSSLLLGFEYMFFSLVNDELYHAYVSQFHAIFGLEKLTNKLPTYIIDQKASLLIWVISGSVLIFSTIFLYFITKWNFKYKFITLSILTLLLFRVMYFLQGGLDFPHPPFRLFPLWLSSTIFSPSNFSFRLPGLVALSVIGLIIYKALQPKISSPFLLYLSIVALLTIPLLWHSSYLVEPSIWAALFSILFLLALQEKKFDNLNFYTWFSLLAIFILMRQSLIFIVLPMLLVYAMERKNLLIKNWKESVFTLSPLMVVIPFLVRSMIVGTPSTSTGADAQLALLEGLYSASSSGILKDIIVSNFEIWSIFIIFAFIPTKKNRFRYFSSLSLFIVCAFIIFYSISPHLWGVPRYQAEYIIPLIILGTIRLLTVLYDRNNKISTYILTSFLVGLLTYNIYTISTSHSHKRMIVNGHPVFISRSVYDYETAFNAAKDNGYAGNTVMLGVTYGVMNEVLYGYSLNELKKQSKFYNEFNKQKGFNVNSLIQNQNIKLIMLSDIGDKKEYIRKALMKNGFSEWKRFSSEKTTDDIIALVRNNANGRN